MADENPPITVRIDPALRPVLRRYAKMLRVSEGKLLAMSFEDINAMIHLPGREPLPQLVALVRAAMEYEASKPKMPSYGRTVIPRADAIMNDKKGVKP